MGALPPHHRQARERLQPFLEALGSAGFAGTVETSEGARTVLATDNSIYQLEPAAVLYPRDGEEVRQIMRAAAAAAMPVAPRGGGTGTNGQSLTPGAVIDLSRHMNRILSLDAARGQVTVEPGVVLDQLNAFLKPHGLFFPPTVSTSSRATIGGMIATDASGKGSRLYGRTSDYVEELDLVLADGSVARVGRQGGDGNPVIDAGLAATGAVISEFGPEIARVFPRMNRGLTGYNLLEAGTSGGTVNAAKLLSGSEGTLAITRAATLRVIPRPRLRALSVVRYGDFSAALDDVARLLGADPAAIEIMDEKVLSLAREDVVWTSLEPVLGGATDRPVMGLNVVEFVGDSPEEVEAALARLAALPAGTGTGIIDQIAVTDQALVATVWELRKKAVGLLGRLGGIPFIEDTAVPPESLPAYVREFRALLDGHGLDYGMFGHADVGCLHVRPVLDMRNPAHAALIRPLSDAVAALTKRFGGLIWGEHGRGFRGEYSPLFFGEALYPALSRIKAAFDPANILNPGKLAAPLAGSAIDRIDGIPFRGERDREIGADLAATYGKAVSCNGNGACHGWDAFDLMCPSYKATRDRAQSPKGRAALLREWARRRSLPGRDEAAFTRFEAEVKASLDTCLSCKACASLCPVKVDIPAMRSEFLADYHGRHPRPARHRLAARLEPMLMAARHAPGLARTVSKSRLVRLAAERFFGLVDLPQPHFARPPAAPRGTGRRVILVEDLFTASFDGLAVEAAEALLTRLGYRVERRRATESGKALQVLGFLARYRRVASRAIARVEALGQDGTPLVAMDAATGLMFADEHAKAAGRAAPAVLGIEQFLAAELRSGALALPRLKGGGGHVLLTHCTEKAARPLTPKLWSEIFAAFGLALETPATGCCGMAGLFGHEKEHKTLSEALFRMSWKPILDKAHPETVLATGFSCRCQTERFEGFRPRHPVEALLNHLTIAAEAPGPAARHEQVGTTHAE